MGINGKNAINSNILKMAERRAKRMKIWHTGAFKDYLCRGRGVVFIASRLSSVSGHTVHLAIFPMLRFSKGYCCQFPSNFNQTLWEGF